MADAVGNRSLESKLSDPDHSWTVFQNTQVELPDARCVADQIDRWRKEHAVFAALADDHGSVVALRRFGFKCRNDRNYDIAIKAWLAALTFDPADAVLWREVAAMHQFAGCDADAEACASRALSIDPHHAATWLQYASVADRLGNADRARAAYLQALSLDPTLRDAHFGLGVVHLRAGRFADASEHLRQSLSPEGDEAVTYLCLGQALYMTAHFEESAEAFERAASFAPLEDSTRRIYARARTFATMLKGKIAEAISGHPALAGPSAESIDELLQAAFSLFSAYGMHEAAVSVGRVRLDREPDDPVQRYLLDAVAGISHDRAPASYVERHFDAFAEGFDDKLVHVLGYSVPQELSELVGSFRSRCAAMLDLGCGTGLAGEPLRRFGPNLTGVDLSQRMLDVAARRGAYSTLVKADIMAFLGERRFRCDLVFAADLLIYFGRLEPMVEAIAESLISDGVFAASIESTMNRGFELLPSGRFAHNESDFDSLVSRGFEIVRKQNTVIRQEAGRPVPGVLYVMRRVP